MVFHHSRDTAYKQWNESRVIALEGVVRILCKYMHIFTTLDCFDESWYCLIDIVRDGILSYRNVTNVEGAEIASEIFVSHVKASVTLMSVVKEVPKLWRSLFDAVCEFGQCEDVYYDTDETTTKTFIECMKRLFLLPSTSSTSASPASPTSSLSLLQIPSNEVGGMSMVLKFLRLLERTMRNRKNRVGRHIRRFGQSISSSERSYINVIEEIAYHAQHHNIETPDLVLLQNTMLDILCQHLEAPSPLLSPSFYCRCLDCVFVLYEKCESSVQAAYFGKTFTLIFTLLSLHGCDENVVRANLMKYYCGHGNNNSTDHLKEKEKEKEVLNQDVMEGMKSVSKIAIATLIKVVQLGLPTLTVFYSNKEKENDAALLIGGTLKYNSIDVMTMVLCLLKVN